MRGCEPTAVSKAEFAVSGNRRNDALPIVSYKPTGAFTKSIP